MRKKPGAFVMPLILGLVAGLFSFSTTAAPGNEPVAGPGWKYRVLAKNLAGVDNLVLAPDGSLYATQERRHGRGRVIHLRNGMVKTVVSGLNRPDGLLLHGSSLYITEEVSAGRVLEFSLPARKLRVLATLRNLEGIDRLPDGDLVVSEDRVDGRLLRVPRSAGKPVEVVLGGLNRPEGLAVKPDGEIVFAETATGRVLSFKLGELNVVVDDLDEPDQVEFAPDGTLWISEDTGDGRLLSLRDGALETVLSGLRFPQGMAFGDDGRIWLAEQGRQRILEIQGTGSRR